MIQAGTFPVGAGFLHSRWAPMADVPFYFFLGNFAIVALTMVFRLLKTSAGSVSGFVA